LLDEDEFKRWFNTALGTVRSAEGDLERGDYNWACFKAHQSAEFAVKGLLRGLGLSAYGRSVSALVAAAPSELKAPNLLQKAKTLDKYYVPTRYPNAWAEGSPADYYTSEDASQAIEYAKSIIGWVEEVWRSLKQGRV
jgi:HEPN domain-containing protein